MEIHSLCPYITLKNTPLKYFGVDSLSLMIKALNKVPSGGSYIMTLSKLAMRFGC